jgi:hypothetical protein
MKNVCSQDQPRWVSDGDFEQIALNSNFSAIPTKEYRSIYSFVPTLNCFLAQEGMSKKIKAILLLIFHSHTALLQLIRGEQE